MHIQVFTLHIFILCLHDIIVVHACKIAPSLTDDALKEMFGSPASSSTSTPYVSLAEYASLNTRFDASEYEGHAFLRDIITTITSTTSSDTYVRDVQCTSGVVLSNVNEAHTKLVGRLLISTCAVVCTYVANVVYHIEGQSRGPMLQTWLNIYNIMNTQVGKKLASVSVYDLFEAYAMQTGGAVDAQQITRFRITDYSLDDKAAEQQYPRVCKRMGVCVCASACILRL